MPEQTPTRWHPEGETPLMAASRTGRVDAVKLLLSHGSFVNAADPYQEETALMWASAEGQLEVVKTLLAAGADPNLKAHVSTITERKDADHPSGGFTALMFAARNGHEDVVEALIKGGADPKLTNADGASATVVAIVNDRFDLAKELIDLGADPNDGSLFFAVDMHDATTDMRAHDGSRLQPTHPNNLTALGLVKVLLDLGADVNKPFVGALHSTTLCCGASINSSPFYRAATAADIEVLKLMLAQGAKIEWSPSEVKPKDGKPRSRPPESEHRQDAHDGRHKRWPGRTDRGGARFHPHWSAGIPRARQPRSAGGAQAAAGGRGRSERQGARWLDAAAPGRARGASGDDSCAGRGRREAGRGEQGQSDTLASGRKA